MIKPEIPNFIANYGDMYKSNTKNYTWLIVILIIAVLGVYFYYNHKNKMQDGKDTI